MRKICFLLLAIFSLQFLQGCSEKFNIAAPYKNITVVYGLLDKADTAHYIRIQKAFLDQSKSALTMAQSADSNFYSQLNVAIKRFDYNYTLIDTIHLTRVDLNKEGYPKQQGVFFNAPNYAYKFKNLLDANYIYRLVITNLITGNVDSAETPIIEDKDNTVFSVTLLDDTDLFTNKLNFNSTLPGRHIELTGNYNAPSGFSFNGYNTPVGLVQMILRFNWNDSNTVTNVVTPKSYDYNLGYQTLAGTSLDVKVNDIDLYYALVSGMGCAPSGIDRFISRCQLFVYLGTYDFYTYEQIIQSQGTGLTGNEIEPTYTNIKGANVLGLFTSKANRSGYVTLHPDTYDSLRVSTIINGCCNLVGKTYQ